MTTTAHTDWQAKKLARAAVAAAVQASNPHLVAAGENPLVAAAKNVRIELARAFKGVKFSVKTSRFSGGDSMTVKWTDGPTTDQVDAIVDRYRAGSFNGSDDSYTYSDSAWRDAFGDAKYTSTVRDYSDAAVAGAIRTVMARYAANFTARQITTPAVAEWRTGRLMHVDVMGGGMHHDFHSLIGRELSRRTWAIDRTPKPAA